jgi:AcrR family transcriptional regulator
MKRAITDEQKSERRREILACAARLILEKDYDHLTLTEVAGSLGLVKGTLYLYFSTKEELFLTLTEQELEVWFGGVAPLFSDSQLSATDLASALTESLAVRPTLLKLFSILHVILERRVSLERIVRFKYHLLNFLNVGATLIEEHQPRLAGKGVQFLATVYELIIGVVHLTDSSGVVGKALENPELTPFRLDFRRRMRASLEIVLKGLGL